MFVLYRSERLDSSRARIPFYSTVLFRSGICVLCCSVSFSVEVSVSVYFVAPAEGVSFV